jgi:hypothetical protein
MRRLTVVLGLIWAIGFGLWFAFGPVYHSTGEVVACVPDPCSPGPVAHAPSSPPPHVEEETSSGLAANGAPILLVVLGVPVFLAAAPLCVPRARQRSVAGVAAVLMLAGAVVAKSSLSLFLYLPSAVALGVAAAWPARRG